LTALAWLAIFESLSRLKPGQSRGFRAKPGRNITRIIPPNVFDVRKEAKIAFKLLFQVFDIRQSNFKLSPSDAAPAENKF